MAGIAALALAYVLSQFYRSFLAVLAPALIQDLGATKADLSEASGAWFIAFALMQFFVGVSLDRFGPRLTAAVMLGVAGGGGALLFAAATAPWMITLAMVLIGIGCAPAMRAISPAHAPAALTTTGAAWVSPPATICHSPASRLSAETGALQRSWPPRARNWRR